MSEKAVNTISSGSVEYDDYSILRFVKNDEKIQAGKCPNDCGDMKQATRFSWECEKCGFVYSKIGQLR